MGSISWSSEEDRILVNFASKHGSLFFTKSSIQSQLKQKLWGELGMIIHKTGLECSVRWRYLRDFNIHARLQSHTTLSRDPNDQFDPFMYGPPIGIECTCNMSQTQSNYVFDDEEYGAKRRKIYDIRAETQSRRQEANDLAHEHYQFSGHEPNEENRDIGVEYNRVFFNPTANHIRQDQFNPFLYGRPAPQVQSNYVSDDEEFGGNRIIISEVSEEPESPIHNYYQPPRDELYEDNRGIGVEYNRFFFTPTAHDVRQEQFIPFVYGMPVPQMQPNYVYVDEGFRGNGMTISEVSDESDSDNQEDQVTHANSQPSRNEPIEENRDVCLDQDLDLSVEYNEFFFSNTADLVRQLPRSEQVKLRRQIRLMVDEVAFQCDVKTSSNQNTQTLSKMNRG